MSTNYVRSKATVVATDEKLGVVEAVVNVTNLKDLQGDTLIPGAYTQVIQSGRLPTICMSHKNGGSGQDLQVLGKATKLEEWMPGDVRLPYDLYAAGYGALVAEMQFNMDKPAGRDAFSDVAGGFIDEFSVGFVVRSDSDRDYDSTSGGWRINTVADLLEISLVLRGASASADGRIRTRALATKSQRAEDPIWTAAVRAMGAMLRADSPHRPTRVVATVPIDKLPDSAFAYIAPNGHRLFPLHTREHVVKAVAQVGSSPFGAKALPAIQEAARRFRITLPEDVRTGRLAGWDGLSAIAR